ncbi:OsmC family protein [bacterium]|nr:OsmC family protein [bacterium]
MRVEIKQSQGLTLTAAADSQHSVIMDVARTAGGNDEGPRPMELVLMGLGGCTAMDVLTILQKKRIVLDDFEMHLEAERSEEHPKVFTGIRIQFIFYGDAIPREAVEKAIELSETKYCSVSAMLKKTARITTEYEIRAPKAERERHE